MKKNSNAYTLIRHMTMSEKRYFKIFSERHTIGDQNKYVALFDLLEKSLAENDDYIKSELRKKKINADFLSADRNYLYNLLLKSLNDFHQNKTINLEVKGLLSSVEILFHKGLYQECLKLISRAEELTKECENYALMIDLLNWKKKCSGYFLGLKRAAEVNHEIDHYTDLLHNQKAYTDLYYKSNLLQSGTEKTSKKEVLVKFNRIIQHPLLRSEKNASCFISLIYYHLIYANYYHVLDKREKERDHLIKLGKMMNQSATYSLENPLDYVSIYGRILQIHKFFSEKDFYKETEILQQFIKKVSIRKEEVEMRAFVHINTNILEFLLIQKRYSEAELHTKAMAKELEKRDFPMEPFHLIYFHYLQAIICTYTGSFSKALKHINTILNEFKESDRPTVFLRVEILNAVIHYEMDHYQLVLSQIKKLERLKDYESSLLSPEKELLKRLKKLAQQDERNLKLETETWKEMADLFEKAKSKNRLSLNSMLDNYIYWFRARGQRRMVSG